MQPLDKNIIRKNFSLAAKTYAKNSRLQRRVVLELLSRCEKYLQKTGGKILDIGCGTGFIAESMATNLSAALTQIDLSLPMCKQAQNHAPALVADAEKLPFADTSFANLLSSLTIQWLPNFESFAAEIHRVLQPNGKFFLSTFGNGTLTELEQAFAYLDKNQHIMRFPSTILLFAQLKKVGFTDIEIHAQKITYRHDNVFEILRQMKDIGASYHVDNSSKGLRGKRYFTQLENAYHSQFAGSDGKISATWNVIYIEGRKL